MTVVSTAATVLQTKTRVDTLTLPPSTDLAGVLVEGNTGAPDGFDDREGVRFCNQLPDYDMAELQEYAKSKGVSLVMHQKLAAPRTYDQQMIPRTH